VEELAPTRSTRWTLKMEMLYEKRMRAGRDWMIFSVHRAAVNLLVFELVNCRVSKTRETVGL